MVVIKNSIRIFRSEHIFDSEPSPLLIRIASLLKNLDEFEFFHVKWENNQMADLQANIGATLVQGVLHVDNDIKICHVP